MMRIVKAITTTAGLTALALSAITSQVWALPQNGVQVDSISAVSADSTWEALDNQHVLVTLGQSNRYILTLTNMCPALTVAAKLGVSTSGDTIYAGFDYVTADGERCLIRDIQRLQV